MELIDVTPRVANPPVVQRVNVKQDPFINLANLMGITVLDDDTNQDLKEKLYRTTKDQRNSSYEGIINALSQDLRLPKEAFIRLESNTTYDTISTINPVIECDGGFLRIYQVKMDNENYILDLEIHLRDISNIQQLVEIINQRVPYLVATIIAYPELPAYSLMRQSNIKTIRQEPLEITTLIKVDGSNILQGSIKFSNQQVFLNEVQYENAVLRPGDYYIDYQDGFIHPYSLPSLGDSVWYQTYTWPFEMIGSAAIVNEISSQSFQRYMFDQIPINDLPIKDITQLMTNGAPTQMGLETIDRLLNVAALYWGK